MSFTWPATLPQLPRNSGASEKAPDLAIRTNMDAGPAKVRRRFTAGVRPHTMKLILTTAQVVILDDFFVSTLSGGAAAFDWVSPRTGGSVEFRFKGPPEYRPLGVGKYEVGFELEELP